MDVGIRYHPQYDGNVIMRWTVYAYCGHPLLGEIHGTRVFTDTEYQAKKIARKMKHDMKP